MTLITEGNPISRADMVDEFEEFADYVNNQIVWASNNEPFSQVSNSEWGGTTSGRSHGLSNSDLGSIGGDISASAIVAALVDEAQKFSQIRKYRPTLTVKGGGGNTGSQPSPGLKTYGSSTAYLNNSHRTDFSSGGDPDVLKGKDVGENALEYAAGTGLIRRLREEWQAICDDNSTAVGYNTDTCHSSCHSSCHGSRGRR